MVIRLAILTGVFFLSLFLPLSLYAVQTGCLACHKAHYAERGDCTECHGGNNQTDRKQVAHDGLIQGKYAWFTIAGSQPVARGKRLVKLCACRRCHSLDGRGNRLAANLDGLMRTRRPAEIALAIERPAPCMPDFHLSQKAVTDVTNAILACGQATSVKTGETPLVVHFADERQQRENIFESKCGGCHRMLNEKYGGLGRGDAGPNLSGLLTSFYPKTFGDNKPWSTKKLRNWLENPRRVRRNAQMPPVCLKEEEFGQLVEILRSKGSTLKS